MPKCKRCGRKGLFLRLTDGLCSDCLYTVQADKERTEIKTETERLKSMLADQQALYEGIKSRAEAAALESAIKQETELQDKIQSMKSACDNIAVELQELEARQQKAGKDVAATERKVQRGRELVRAIRHSCEQYEFADVVPGVSNVAEQSEEYIKPTVTLNLQCLDMKELRKRYRQNEKNIQTTLDKYKDRYATKANITIYRLMVIALKAELQNVLHNIGYGKLDDAVNNIRTITNKYYVIAAEGSKSIEPTVKKFIGEIDYFFQEAVKIEYEYYVQKERAKEEQRAIREQMRQEAEERRELERQRKQIEKEESKYADQITQLTAQMEQADDVKNRALQARIEELQRQLKAVEEQKDKITQLQNGKAGNVYVISNIGSFGENVFKVGMTRRLEPMERVNELGSASVPFPFDVHSMIFSDDAVGLETKLHHILNNQRVNKVNLRKEFFRVPLDDLQKLVEEIEPTAEFKRTVLAEQYRQSLSIMNVVETNVASGDDGDDEDDLIEMEDSALLRRGKIL